MGNRLDPGPPLTAGEEYCATESPSGTEYAKASLVALLLAATGAGVCFGVALATHRLWGVMVVVVGVMIGLAVHHAAGRHRSGALGGIAAGATMIASLAGYSLLWLPFVSPTVDRSLSWVHLVMIGLGLFIAFLMAGPRPAAKAQ